MKKNRFSDRIGPISASGGDFVVRRRTRAQQIYYLFLMTVVVIAGVGLLLYNEALLASQICVVVGCVMYYAGRKFERMGQQLLAAEFMNAMFASALGINCKFCMVAKPDGDIVFIDRGFQHMFPDYAEHPQHSLESLFGLYLSDAGQRQKIISAVGKGASEVVNVFVAGGQDKAATPIQLVIEPIPRPKNFVLLRGKAA